MPTVAPYPHQGACPECRKASRCNYCGKTKSFRDGCTNGRCSTCHMGVCTGGGVHGPGHGFGQQGGAHFLPE